LGVNFRPVLYNFQDEQPNKAAVLSEENEMVSVNLSIRCDDEVVLRIRLIEPNQICFVGHRNRGTFNFEGLQTDPPVVRCGSGSG
jgi:hypothetical protein